MIILNTTEMILEKIKNIPKRQICIRACVHPRTLDKYLNNEIVNYNKAQKIKNAIASLIEEQNETENRLLNL